MIPGLGEKWLGSTGTPNRLELAALERLMKAANLNFGTPGVWDERHKKGLQLLQRELGLPTTGYLDSPTKGALGTLYSYLGGTKNGPSLDELGWQPTTVNKATAKSAGFSMSSGVTRSPSLGTSDPLADLSMFVPGGGGGGGGGGGDVGTYGSPGSRNPGQIAQYIKDKYPGWAPFLNHPEIGPILMNAAQWDHDALWVEGQLMGTNWWKTNSQAQRDWEILQATNPAEAARLADGRFTDLFDFNAQFGVGLSAEDLRKIATDSLSLGWSDAQIKEHLASFVTMDDTSRDGLVSDIFDQAHNLSGDFFVGIDDATALDFARKVISGELNVESMQGYFRDQAKKQYAHLADVVDQGVTLRQYFEPHRQTLSQLLEVAPESVDFLNDKRYSAVMTTTDKDTGKTRAMTVTEVAEMARKDKRWEKTRNAKSTAATTVAGLGEAMGMLKF